MDLNDIFNKDFGNTQERTNQNQNNDNSKTLEQELTEQVSFQKYEGYEGTLLL